MSPVRARLLLLALAALLVWGLLPSSNPAAPARRVPEGRGDAALYKKVVARLSEGEPYYQALGAELRLDNYPTTSPFNWRTPAHLEMVALIGEPVAALFLKLLALAAVLATAGVLARSGTAPAIAGTVAQMGAVATAFSPDAAGIAEIWAGVLVALSLCAYVRGWWMAGALTGIAALFMRELTAPYVVVCAVLALRARRREAAVWIAAGLAYAVYYGVHVWQVGAHQMPGDLAHTESWLRWNSVTFNLSTIGVNGWLALLPRPAAAPYMVLGLAGAASLRIVPQARAALLAYTALFAIAGLPFNYYWGFITAPVWAFGFAHAWDGLHRLTAAGMLPGTLAWTSRRA